MAKYVCTSGGPAGRRYHVFAEYETHADVAREMGGAVLSAGFVAWGEGGLLRAYGRSDSLGVAANERVDTYWLRMILK